MPNIQFGLVTAVTLSVAAVAICGGCSGEKPAPITKGKRQQPVVKASTGTTSSQGPVVSHLEILKIRTDSQKIAVGNLESAIRAKSAQVAQGRSTAAIRWELVHHHLTRARYLGYTSGFVEAEKIVNRLLESGEPDADALMLRADVHAALHRFNAALKDLKEAEGRGGNAGKISKARLSIHLAQGKVEEPLKKRKQLATLYPSWKTLARLATAYVAAGEYEDAEATYNRALKRYRSTSPFVVAWAFFARGVMWAESLGDDQRGRALYEAALEHLPDYLVANIHLAELEAGAGETAQAIERLVRLDRPDIDPELLGKLSTLMARTGQPEKAKEYAKRATERYNALLKWAPEAWSDHGTEFFMDVGKDPQRALSLAKRNLEVRQTPRARALVIEASLASGRPQDACRVIQERPATAIKHLRLTEAVAAAKIHCGKTQRAGSKSP